MNEDRQDRQDRHDRQRAKRSPESWVGGVGWYPATVFTMFFLVLSLTTEVCGCKSQEETRRETPNPPTDHLAAGEVPEGKARAFGLSLPYMSTVVLRTDKRVDVSSPLSWQDLTKFVRARVPPAHADVTVRESDALFDNVVTQENPERTLRIEVRAASHQSEGRSELVIRDVTAPAPEPDLSKAERLRRVGLLPNGKLADPANVE